MRNPIRFWTLTALVTVAAANRLVPHPPNVTPVTAIALLGGANLANPVAAALVPFGTLLLSDAALQLGYTLGWQPVPGFYAGQWVVYLCMLPVVGIGMRLRACPSLPRAAAASFVGSLLFFLATNLVWVYGPYSLYPRSLAGLLTSYEMALPFFRNSVLGDVGYTIALFGTWAWVECRFPVVRTTEVVPSIG